MRKNYYFILFTAIAISAGVLGQKEDCFQQGECIESFHLSSDFATDEYACLENCNDFDLCNWFTFSQSINYCQLLHNCSFVDVNQCPDCLSGQSECVPEEPTCFIEGECKGNMIHFSVSVSMEECLQDCKNTFGCKWFTFHSVRSPESTCILYRDCPALDETCETCVSGERRCEDDSQSTTDVTTFTTPTTSTPSAPGFVAFVVGGYSKNVELYSPNDNCQYNLAPLPFNELYLYLPALAWINDQILVCGGRGDKTGNKFCWSYNTTNNNWMMISTSNYEHEDQPGAVYKDRIYIFDNKNPEVFDPTTNTWSTWPKPTINTGSDSCLLSWNDMFLLIGGIYAMRTVQTFNHSTQSWSVLDSGKAPIDILLPGCIMLPTEEVLILGSDSSGYHYSTALYNPQSNTWTHLEDSNVPHWGSTLVTLGKRVFAIDGHDGNFIEEFHYHNNTLTPVEAKLITWRNGHTGVLSLPAEMFSHLPNGCIGVQ